MIYEIKLIKIHENSSPTQNMERTQEDKSFGSRMRGIEEWAKFNIRGVGPGSIHTLLQERGAFDTKTRRIFNFKFWSQRRWTIYLVNVDVIIPKWASVALNFDI